MSQPASSRRARDTGFTLIEMMVALFVFAILAASATAILSSSLSARDVLSEREAFMSRLQVARAVLKADFGQLSARTARDPETGGRFDGLWAGYDRGGGTLAQLVRAGWINPGAVEERGSLQLVSYLQDEDRLIRRHYLRVDVAPETPHTDRVLLEGVEDLTLSFFTGTQWVERWPVAANTGGLPRAVAIEMELEGLGPVRQVFLAPGDLP